MFNLFKKPAPVEAKKAEPPVKKHNTLVFDSEVDRSIAIALMGVGMSMIQGVEPGDDYESTTLRLRSVEQVKNVAKGLAAAMYLGGTGNLKGKMSDLHDVLELRDGTSEADGFDDRLNQTLKRLSLTMLHATLSTASRVVKGET